MLFVMTPYEIEDLSELKAAGADAVIISTPVFSTRGAHNFAIQALPQIKQECVRLNLQLFVQVNRFFIESDLSALYTHMKFLKSIQVDGIYFGDEAVLQIGEELGMKDLLIYQPDTLLTNSPDVNFYLKQGIHSVSLAKEITLEEIQSISLHTRPAQLEVMIHGRLNMMSSKRKLLSNYFSFIQKDVDMKEHQNLYLMEETRDEHMPIVEDDAGTHIFSGFTLCSFEEIESLKQMGIGYVRIEGFGKDLAYCIQTLSLYKEILAGTKNASDVYTMYQNEYPLDHNTKGFLYTKTSMSK